MRIIDTDNNSFSVWASDTYRVLATDGYDVHEPGPVDDAFTVVGAGGRVDLEVTVPDGRLRGARWRSVASAR